MTSSAKRFFLIDPFYDALGADREDIDRHVKIAHEHGIELKTFVNTFQHSSKILKALSFVFLYLRVLFFLLFKSRKNTVVFHADMVKFISLPFFIAYRLLGFSTILHVHRVPQNPSNFFFLNLKAAHKIYVTEQIIKDNLLKSINRPILCYNFYDIKGKVYPKALTNSKVRVNFIGAVREEKGIKNYLELVQKLPADLFEFKIIGKIADDDFALKKEVELACVKANVFLENRFIDKEEFGKLIAESDFIMLSYDREEYFCRGSGMIYDLVLQETSFIAQNFGVFKFYADNFKIGITYDDVSELAEHLKKYAAQKEKFTFAQVKEYYGKTSYTINYTEFLKEAYE